MNYFTDYKRHGRYFDPPPYETADYKMNNDFRRSHHENAYHNTYNELPRCNYGPSHIHNSYENFLHGNHAAKRSRENYQHCDSNAPYYYNNINSPMMHHPYYNGESYRRESSPAPSSYHGWMNNGYPPQNHPNSQYFPPVNYGGNSSPYYPTPPPSASPAGNFYSSKTSERLPNYEFEYYKEKSESASEQSSSCYPYNEMNSNRTMFPKMDYASNADESERKHPFQSTEQTKSTKFHKTKESEEFEGGKFKDEKLEMSGGNNEERFVDSQFFKKSSDSATENDKTQTTTCRKQKLKESDSFVQENNDEKMYQSSIMNSLPDQNRDHVYDQQNLPYQLTSDFHSHMMTSHENFYNKKKHNKNVNWYEARSKSNKRYSLLELKTPESHNNLRRNAPNDKKNIYNNFSPTTRKRKMMSESQLENKIESKDTIPLPGFLQTFGQTEIGRFSEAFCSSSDSPFYNSIESDVDSPHPWEQDSLEGPVKMKTSFQICSAGISHGSPPLNNFSELICNEC